MHADATASMSRPSTTVPVRPGTDGLRRSARVAGDHRQPGGRRLQEHDAEPLDVQSADHGCGRAWRTRRPRRSSRADRRTAPTRSAARGRPRRSASASSASARPIVPAADDQQQHVGHRRPGSAAAHRSTRPDPCVGPAGRCRRAPAGRRSRAARADPFAGGRVGVGTPRCRRPGGRYSSAASRSEGGGDPAAGVLADEGDHVGPCCRSGAEPGGRRAASTSRPRARGCWPAPAATPCRAGDGREQRQRCGRAEPDRGQPVLGDQSRPPGGRPTAPAASARWGAGPPGTAGPRRTRPPRPRPVRRPPGPRPAAGAPTRTRTTGSRRRVGGKSLVSSRVRRTAWRLCIRPGLTGSVAAVRGRVSRGPGVRSGSARPRTRRSP